MSTPSSIPVVPPCVLHLIELSRRAHQGDEQAAQGLRFAGELLDLAGGAQALCDVQGIAHDHLLDAGHKGPDLAGLMGAYWEHIPSWAAL